jgi:hypothetical protein
MKREEERGESRKRGREGRKKKRQKEFVPFMQQSEPNSPIFI